MERIEPVATSAALRSSVATAPLAVLLVEDNPMDALVVRSMLDANGLASDLVSVESLAAARACFAERAFDVVLLDLFLPDARGLDTLLQLRVEAPEAAVVVLTGSDDDIALRAVSEGAQDYLRKADLDGDALNRAVRHGVARNRLLGEIRRMSLRDELTGLFNRRGFLTLAEQQSRVAQRTGRGMGVFFVDLDGMKAINDRLGHREGDRALRDAALMLGKTFRASDILARMGGDEFVALALEAESASMETILGRLEARLREHNDGAGRPFVLAMSIGAIWFDPAVPVTVEALLSQADDAMYAAKRAKRELPGEG